MPAELELIVAAVTGALTGGTAKPLVAPAEALAEHWKDKVRARLERVGREVERKALTNDLIVNERVAYRVLSEAAFSDDGVIASYLAGVIVGTSPELDDGIPVLAEISRLSSFQLRMHYILYRAHHQTNQAVNRILFVPRSGLERAFVGSFDLLSHELILASRWLRREGILRESGLSDGYGNDDSFRIMHKGDVIRRGGGERGGEKQKIRRPEEDGLLFTPTEHGVELLRWACGLPRSTMQIADQALEMDPMVPACTGMGFDDLPDVSVTTW